MQTPTEFTFQRIARAIDFLQREYRQQPSLEAVAGHIGMSAFHFQRLFTEWAGVSPKKFVQYLTLAHAKSMLRENHATLFDAADATGLSGTGRLHDLFVRIEGMTPGEYKNGGAALTLCYHFAESPFGRVLMASSAKGICHLAFADDDATALTELKKQFPRAQYHPAVDLIHSNVRQLFTRDWSRLDEIKLHLKATPFQLKVWEALLKIPQGRLTTYGALAQRIAQPNASRAVGSAVGDNPVAFLIPCHRVIQSTGMFGQYHWGPLRKQVMIGWEAAQREAESVFD
ncbi:MAG: methylated-DNA--[protein]-cysteine S-methyltransferase [Cyclobacteriaceae bacterium]|jgi:AraC family transcriptional regulator of adaptative response/methylated-DNA-[protein]-cysteine methyltransferase|nr:methylated-DNA--[protein]-cysteine S-methyltransferase [Cyclobacteriaceae bacterium]